MVPPSRPRYRRDFQIAIICALQVEHDAVESLIDEEWETFGKAANDLNTYTTGRMGSHFIVLAYMPGMGKANAATVALGLKASFPEIRLALVVGVCGGAPETPEGTAIFLGDIVVSTMIMQIDFGRRYPNRLAMKSTIEGNLGSANLEIQSFIKKVTGKITYTRLRDKTASYSQTTYQQSKFEEHIRPDAEQSSLFPPDYRHKHQKPGCAICDECQTQMDEVCAAALTASCTELGCATERLLARSGASQPHGLAIHFGRVASGDSVIKSAYHRDEIIRESKVIAFEMEGAGAWNILPTIVVKGVCDFADSHKSKSYQGLAAINAAACAKALIEEWTSARPLEESAAFKSEEDPKLIFMRSLTFECMDARQHRIPQAHRDSCHWLFSLNQFPQWLDEEVEHHEGFLWIKGEPGAGKSVLMKHTLQHCRRQHPTRTIAAYFFYSGGDVLEKSPLGMLRSILYQIIDANPRLYDYIDRDFLRKLKKTVDGVIIWYKQELEEIMRYLVECDHFQPTFLFIDGLDECDDEVEVRRLVSFLEDLSVVASRSKKKLRICVSSRHYPTINVRRKLEVVIDSQPGHDTDIAEYIEDKLMAKDHSVKLQLLEMAQGVFLWVSLVVEMLNRTWDEGRVSALQEKLIEVPADLDEVFRVLLKHTSDPTRLSQAAETLLMFQWVLFASQPLNMKELYFAVKAGTDPASLGPWDMSIMNADSIVRFIVSGSRGLIECRSYVQNVQFVHETVSSYLLRSKVLHILDPTLMSDITGQSHERLARACFEYIVSTGPQYAHDPRYPFLGYASRNAVWHVRQVHSSRSSSFIPLSSLQLQEVLSGAWNQLLILSNFKTSGATHGARANLLYILAAHGSSQLMAQALSKLSVSVPERSRHDVDPIQEIFGQWVVRRMQFLLKISERNKFAPFCRLLLLFMIAGTVWVECFWPLTLLLTIIFAVPLLLFTWLQRILRWICSVLLHIWWALRWISTVVHTQIRFLRLASSEGKSLWISFQLLQIPLAVLGYPLALFLLPFLMITVLFRYLWDTIRLRSRDHSD